MVDAFVLLNNCQRCFGRDRLVPPRPAVELVPDQSPYSERGFSFNAARLQNKPVFNCHLFRTNSEFQIQCCSLIVGT